MIRTNYFIFVHLEKTGGSWIREVMHFYPGLRPSLPCPAVHAPLSELAPTTKTPALCFVRNPWDWYVSLYEWKRANIEGRRYDWALPQKHWSKWHWEVYRQFSDFETSVRESISFPGYFHRLTNHPQIPLHPKRMEDGLARGLLDFLDEIDMSYSPALVSHMETKHKVNVNPHEHYRTYYSADLRDFVAQRDAELIERFKYSF